MKTWAIGATAVAAIGFFLGLSIYLVQGGGSQQVIPDKPQPKVAGRLTSGYVGENESGGFIGQCEFDALVLIKDGRVVEVLAHGDRPEVKVGDAVANPPADPLNPGASSHATEFDIGVYWGSDSKLYAGCAPESVIYQGGQEIPIKDLPSPVGGN